MTRPTRPPSRHPARSRRLRLEALENRNLLASIAGLVWDDLNGDGARQGGEGPLAGVTVFLDVNNSGALDAGEPSTQSAIDGSYQLAAVAAGNHTVRQVVSANHRSTAPQLSGQRLFAVDIDTTTDRIVELNPQTGAELGNFAAPVSTSFGNVGLAFDGQTIYFLSDGNDTLYELNPAGGAILDQTVLPSASYGGLAVLGGKVYALNTSSRALTVFNPATNAITAGPDLDSVNSGFFIRDTLGQSHLTGELLVQTSDYIAFVAPVTGRRLGSVPSSNGFSAESLEALGAELFVGASFVEKLDVHSRTTGGLLRSLMLTFAPADTAGFADASGAHRVTLTSNQAAANLDFGVQFVLGSLRGTRWSDTNSDGIRQVGEPPLAGKQVYLDINGDGIRNGSGGLEPDNYVDGTVLNTVHPGVTLSRVDQNNNPAAFNVVAKTDTWGYTSTGVKSFAYGAGVDWWNNTSRLKMAFTVPVSRISIDFTGGSLSGTEFGRLNAYNARGELVGTYLTGGLVGGADETMTVVRSLPDIAYAVAYTETGTFGMLDNLTYGILEPTATTAADGSYEFTGLLPGDYTVKSVVNAGYTQTYPDLSVDRLFVTDIFQDKIIELNPATGAVVRSSPVPTDTSITTGLAFDGKVLWFISDSNDTLYRLNPDTGAVLGSTALPQGSYQELAALGGLIYVQDMFDGNIYVFDPAASAIVRTITTTGFPDAFIYDGLGEMTGPDRLLERGLQNELLVVDPATGVISVTFSLQLSTPYGLTSVGKEIFAGNSSGRIDVYSRTGALLRTFNDAPDVFALAGAAGANGAHKVTLAPNQSLIGLDFGTTEPGNTPPTSQNDNIEAREDHPLNILASQLLANDSDPDSPSLTVVKQSDPAHGSLSVNANGSLTYTPVLNYVGPDSFTYRASDGLQTGNVATVFLNVAAVNDAPSFTVGDDLSITDIDGTVEIDDWILDALAGPQEASQALSFAAVADKPELFSVQPRISIVSGSQARLSFAVAPNKVGQATISVVLKDNGGTANGGSDLAPPQTFKINIVKANPGHNELIAEDVTADGAIAPGDALEVINFINAFGSRAVPPATGNAPPYYDMTGDGSIAPEDALGVINYINANFVAGAPFLGTDATTQGNWKGVYGGGGVALNSRVVAPPAYATLSFTGGLTDVYDYVQAESTSDPRALLEPVGSGRFAAEWTGDHGFTLNLNLVDRQTHRVALHMLDWGNNGRSQKIEIFDANKNTLLDTRTVNDFGDGVYLVWSLRGNIKIRFTNLANGLNTVLSGVFFE